MNRIHDGGRRQRALVLAGGGARAAYQVGVLHFLRELAPEAEFPIITGVSAGAINAAYLASHRSIDGASRLRKCWEMIGQQDVFQVDSGIGAFRRILRRFPLPDTIMRLREGEALLDTSPLRAFLARHLPAAQDGALKQVQANLDQGTLRAACITTSSFSTGQSVTWVQGRDIEGWERPNRVAYQCQLTLDHVMASSALPLLFPAVEIRGQWYGDGGIRLMAPLSPALHLGATDILAISTRYDRSRQEAEQPAIVGYPPPAQVVGVLLNAVFLDTFDHDVQELERISNLVERIPVHERHGLRPVRHLLLRPSRDIGRLARGYESKTKGVLRLLARGLGSQQTESPDWLSMMLFEHEFVCSVLETGWEDARRQRDAISAFLDGNGRTI